MVANVIWFPLGPFTDGAAQNLGVEGHIEQAFLISSTLPASTASRTARSSARSIHEYRGGVRYRMPFGAGNYFLSR